MEVGVPASRCSNPAAPGGGRGLHGQSLATIRRRWVAAAFTACALYAGAVALFTRLELHRFWGVSAAAGYLLAAVALAAWRPRRPLGLDLALALSLCGALVVPLAWMTAAGKQQPEVTVIVNSARMLVHHGTPYQSAAALAAAHHTYAYDPYLPVMTLFGLPRALAGAHMLTDPRIWFGVIFVVAFGLALAAAGGRDWLRWTAFIAASPVVALELAVGGTDVPVLALMCLGMALLWTPARQAGPDPPDPRAASPGGPARDRPALVRPALVRPALVRPALVRPALVRPALVRPALAGLALGVAAAMKATAWPALVIAFVLLLVTEGRRAATRFTLTALAACAVLIGPFAAVAPGALVANTISFPLGLTSSKSPAASPLPGHLLAATGHTGHLIAVGLLALAGLAIAASLVVRPPRTVPSATWRLILGLALMFTLAPATRFGYYLYPLGLLVWLLIAGIGRRAPPEGPRADSSPHA